MNAAMMLASAATDMTSARLAVAGGLAATALLAAAIAIAIVGIAAYRRRAPAYVVQPVPAIGRMCTADALVAAWRAAGFCAVRRRRRIDVQTTDGALTATLAVPASRKFGDAAFLIASRSSVLVRQLLTIASAELGPLVCSIDGCTHGFHAEPSPPRASQPAQPQPLCAAAGSSPRAAGSVRDRAARSADDGTLGTARTALLQHLPFAPIRTIHDIRDLPRHQVTLRGVPAVACA